MASQRDPKIEIEVNVPSCSLTREDLLEIGRRIDRHVDREDEGYAHFTVNGHDFSLSADRVSDLEKLPWPERISSLWFNVERWKPEREIAFRISKGISWSASMEITGTDPVWVRGVAAEFEKFFASRRNRHSLLNNMLVGSVLGVTIWAAIFGGVALGLYAADSQAFEKESSAWIAFIVPAVFLSGAFLIGPWHVLPVLFPYIEFRSDQGGEGVRGVRRVIFGAAGALLVALAANFVVAGLSILWK